MGLFDGISNAVSSGLSSIGIGGDVNKFVSGAIGMHPMGLANGALLGGGIGGSKQPNQIPIPGATPMPVNLPPASGQGGAAAPGTSWQTLNNYTNEQGTPVLGGFNSIRGQDGKLMSQYQMTPQKMGDASTWSKLANQQNDLMTANQVDAANKQSLSNTQQGMSELAMVGGISSGARERMAASGARDGMFATQDARNQGNLNAANINLNAEQMNRDAQKFNIGNDMSAQQFNASNAINDVANLNNMNLTGYQERMKDFTGTKLADAMSQGNAMSANAQNNSPWGRLANGALSFLGF